MNRFPVEISYEGVKYSFTVLRQAPDAFTLSINGQVGTTSSPFSAPRALLVVDRCSKYPFG